MKLSRHPVPAHRLPSARPRVVRFRTLGALFLGSLSLLAACGGGGGGQSAQTASEIPAMGIEGRVLLPDVDLGRVIEQEPNDAGQPFHLPPVAPRTHLEVTGTVGTTAAWFGRSDPVDAFRYETLGAQEVEVTLTYPPTDPVGGGDNDLALDVFDFATGTLLGSATSGPSPRSTAVLLPAGDTLRVVVTCQSGHAGYVLAFAASDTTPASPSPKAVARSGSAPASPDPGVSEADCASMHLLVHLRPGADPEAVAARHGMAAGRHTAAGSYRFELAAPASTSALASKRVAAVRARCVEASSDPDVEWAEPDWIVQTQGEPADPEYARQWNLRAIGASGAWAITRGSPNVIVGIVDTGIVEHPDLDGQVVPGYDFITDPAVAGDGNGRDPDPTDQGDQKGVAGLSTWHGTHVAAIVAGKADNGFGTCGVAPGCKVMPLRAIGIGGGLVSDVADAILYAAGLYTTADGHVLAQPLPIVNLSLGVDQDSTELRDACSAAANVGVLLVAAVGNTGGDVLYPAKYDGVLAVAAVDGDLMTTGYSNYGPDVDLSAPGGLSSADVWADGWPDGILSASLDETLHPRAQALGELEGTSQAAPHVAGAAALLLSIDPTLPRTTVELLLTRSAREMGVKGKDNAYGWGVLDVPGAMRLLYSYLSIPDPEPPSLGLTTESLSFAGFELRHDVGVIDLGGDGLVLENPIARTDDGAGWLSAQNVSDSGVPGDISRIAVTVDRTAVSTAPGRYSGTVFVRGVTGTVLGSIRVVLYTGGQRLRAGLETMVVARDATTGIARVMGRATPVRGYRYWFPNIPNGQYKVMAGTDVDGDGFFCEGGDACGWYGGVDEATAGVLDVVPSHVISGADVVLRDP